ncbi:hypothetical protein BO79DRAFT_214907 [Aspergillus costaricaensis CBS 115574]|uniref:Uncharacterized protein n=1 Tax=Aspergillus costaricaensis CBS 115574 TaxID=1448317 RepID=A0ACD1INH0_9EURO|nr:hypothetical protein BO79DRAFT_214907 [Aspergillus costaricaensis CBS 115574]RAK91962.1 hypothetical protein BO79DRAFT_214907 [Aspergillus costaricaensis CBS 115574]
MFQAGRTPQQLFTYLKYRILQTGRTTYFELEGIPPDTGQLVARSLAEDGEVERRSPTLRYYLEAHLQGIFTSNESRHVNLGGNSGFYGSFVSPWADSYKEPDTYIMNYESLSPLPTVVIESGYAESTARLYADRDLWLQGGALHVNVVILIKWNKRVDNHIDGWIELHRRGGSDVPERFEHPSNIISSYSGATYTPEVLCQLVETLTTPGCGA